MGGLLGGGQAPSPPPAPLPQPDPEATARQQRLDAMERNRRGRYGTIATSDRGLLEPVAGTGKSLLGE
ncbi:MAG: hypothetical protein HYU60_02220 [Magnetospirillum sp.]|nr:hypothetical protein [Magnetospirillum sp.]